MEWARSEDGKYKVVSVTADNFLEAQNVVRIGHFPDEAVCCGCEVNKNTLAMEELLELTADTVLDGLSIVAINNDTGEVVSALFNKIQVAPSETSGKTFFEQFMETRCTQPSSRALVDLMIELDGRCNFFEKYNTDCYVELMFLTTLREHRHKGLGLLLCKTAVEIAKILKNGPISKITVEDLGPEYAFLTPRTPSDKVPTICVGLWSSIGSQKIGKKLNFDVLLRVSMTEFVYNGKTYTDRIGKEMFCEAAALKI